MNDVQEKLAAIILSCGSQAAAAERLGVNQSTISNAVHHGKVYPKLARRLGFHVEYGNARQARDRETVLKELVEMVAEQRKAIGTGALAVRCRMNDDTVLRHLKKLAAEGRVARRAKPANAGDWLPAKHGECVLCGRPK